jgi:hypothetical protein
MPHLHLQPTLTCVLQLQLQQLWPQSQQVQQRQQQRSSWACLHPQQLQCQVLSWSFQCEHLQLALAL